MPPKCASSNPTVTVPSGFAGNDGTYRCTGECKSSLPCSHNCIAATAVTGFEIDPNRYTVCAVAGTKFSRS